MKSIHKLPKPATLIAYRTAQPDGTWEQMRNDPHHDGMQAYRDVKTTLVRSQRGLCVYCERYIAADLSDTELEKSKSNQAVEHFHPKSDPVRPPNWALHWPNLWSVYMGGRPANVENAASADYLPPLPENLSCDAYKDRQVVSGKLPLAPEGQMLAPHEVPSFPRLFRYMSDGTVEPDPVLCAAYCTFLKKHTLDMCEVSNFGAPVRRVGVSARWLHRSRRAKSPCASHWR